MEKFSIGVLSWHSTDVLVKTLLSYHDNGLLSLTDDVTIWFQECNEVDEQIANHFNIRYIASPTNVGIGQAFVKLTEQAKYDNVLILEHDWNLIEDINTTNNRIQSGIQLLHNGFQAVRYRHRAQPGYPHFSMFKYQGRELEYFDEEFQLPYPHLLDCIHWINEPSRRFPDMIHAIDQSGDFYNWSSSRYGNFTNNPTLYKKQFYLDVVNRFQGDGIALEGNISRWWALQDFKVAHGEGLFTHNDFTKYNNI